MRSLDKPWKFPVKLGEVIIQEGHEYVALCPELDIASQGDTIEQARDNLREALELFLETASPEEKQARLGGGNNGSC